MGTASSKEIQAITPSSSTTNVMQTETKPGEKKCKACCACPETKKVRDECIITKGEEHCGDLIEAHKECMRKMGFKI